MKLNGPMMTALASWPASLAIRSLMGTLRYQALYRDPTVDPALHPGPPRIYVFWHENILFPLYLRGGCHLAMLLSQHRDADILERIAHRFGFDCVRGSTYRGGARALRELAEQSRTKHLTITPDGPRGPRRRLAQGPVYLASKLGLPIVCLGFAYHRPWRMNSWDQFAVPRPFSRARAVVSEAIPIPTDLDRAGIETWRVKIESELNRLTDEAQAWADDGHDRAGSQPLRRATGSPPMAERAIRLAA